MLIEFYKKIYSLVLFFIKKEQLVFQRLHLTVMHLNNWGYFPARNGENQVKKRLLSNSCDKIILELFPEPDNLLICLWNVCEVTVARETIRFYWFWLNPRVPWRDLWLYICNYWYNSMLNLRNRRAEIVSRQLS